MSELVESGSQNCLVEPAKRSWWAKKQLLEDSICHVLTIDLKYKEWPSSYIVRLLLITFPWFGHVALLVMFSLRTGHADIFVDPVALTVSIWILFQTLVLLAGEMYFYLWPVFEYTDELKRVIYVKPMWSFCDGTYEAAVEFTRPLHSMRLKRTILIDGELLEEAEEQVIKVLREEILKAIEALKPIAIVSEV